MASGRGTPAAPAGPPTQQQAEEVSRHSLWRAAAGCRQAKADRPCRRLPPPPLNSPSARCPRLHPIQAAGAEFFRRRLQRAAAIPPEQRDPAVHAFVSSVQLMRAADELLLLTDDRSPALPADTLAGQQAEVQAFLLAATAMHIAPGKLEWEGRQQNRVGCYFVRRMLLAGDSWDTVYQPALQPLGGLLLRLLMLCYASCPEEACCSARAAVQEARSARSIISRQLQQAQRSSGQQVLTAEQLEAELHRWLGIYGTNTLVSYTGQRGSSAPSWVAAAVAASSEQLLLLEPSSPRALHAAAMGFAYGAGSSSAVLSAMQRGLDCLIAAFRAAEAAPSPFWKVKLVAHGPSPLPAHQGWQ